MTLHISYAPVRNVFGETCDLGVRDRSTLMLYAEKARSYPAPTGNDRGDDCQTPPRPEGRPSLIPPSPLANLQKADVIRSNSADLCLAPLSAFSQSSGKNQASVPRYDKRYPLAPPVPAVPREFLAGAPTEEAASTQLPSKSTDAHLAPLGVLPSVRRMVAAEAGLPSESTQKQEEAVVQQLSILHQLLANTATAPGLGWAANVLHAAGREGTITYLTTAIREVVGQLVAQRFEHAPDHVKVSVSAGIIAATGMLNALAAIRQHTSGQANWMTRSAQATNVALLGAAAGIALKTGGLGNAAPLLVKATAYSLTRDGINLFVRLSDNRDAAKGSANGRAVFTNMAVYGANQIAVNELQGLGAAYSGTSAAAQAESARHAYGHVSAFSAANAAGESVDALLYPALAGFYDNLGNGLRAALKGVQDVRLATRVHVPFGKEVINHWAGRDLVGSVTRDDVWQKATCAMLARESLFVILYTLMDAISKVGPAANLNARRSEHLTNALAGLSIGLMVASFVGMASASSRPAALTTDPETGLVNGGLGAAPDLPATEPPRRPSHSVEHP